MNNSDFTSGFWHYYIAFIIVIAIIGLVWLLWSQKAAKTNKPDESDTTTKKLMMIKNVNEIRAQVTSMMFYLTFFKARPKPCK